MKRLIATVGLCAVLVASLESQLRAAAPESQSIFFGHVATSNLQKLMDMMDPALQAEVDEPVLKAWVAAFHEYLGPVTGIRQYGWSTKAADGGMLQETKCEIICERGTADSVLTTLNGKLIAFAINSDQLKSWFTGPAGTELYERTGAKFIELFLAGNGKDAYAMCHPALKKVISASEFDDMIRLVQEKTGQLQGTSVTGTRFEISDDGENLLLDFEVAGRQGTVTCEIKIQFVGMKGHLLGFNFMFD